ncbi:xylulokinase [Marinococcus luteus]|uniref:Xylulokinase n=1 Tax=Marinococcus luteus TaxID=1122204 RepID=A0A1H2XVQ5_9BACI|nr:FGGY family carbohydrate kinase [Marinococcus luteus]SDW96524.1 xylulokinase [Marinococcus luteus]
MSCRLLSADLGTTSLKVMILNGGGQVEGSVSEPVHTYTDGGNHEQKPPEWWQTFRKACRTLQSNGIDLNVDGVVCTGQMEDFIPFKDGRAETAILYSDTRGSRELTKRHLPPDVVTAFTGNDWRATTPLMKWMADEFPEQWDQVLFGSKDYLIYRLTGASVCDPVNGTVTGMMNIHTRAWEEKLWEGSGIFRRQLPRLLEPEETAGYVLKEAASQTGIPAGTPVYCGLGDGGAVTLAASAHAGNDEGYAYAGTTGWTAVPADTLTVSEEGSVFHLAAPQQGRFIKIMPLLNMGNVHQWAVHTWCGGDFEAFEKLIAEPASVSGSLLFIPYLNGERNPVIDEKAKGAFIGIDGQVTQAHMARAVLEGLAFSLKQTFFQAGVTSSTLFLVGGGTKSRAFRQTVADVFQCRVQVSAEQELLASFGAAACGFRAIHKCSWEEAARAVQSVDEEEIIVAPDVSKKEKLERKERLFIEAAGRMRGLFNT